MATSTAKEDRKTYVELAVRLLSLGNNTITVHKAFAQFAEKAGKMPPTYRQTLSIVGSAREQMRSDVQLSREEMQSLVWRSLWDMHKDTKNKGEVRLGALKEINRLYGLYAPTRMHHHVTSGIPLTVILAETDGPAGLAEVVDGNLIDLDAYAALPAPAKFEAEGSNNGEDDGDDEGANGGEGGGGGEVGAIPPEEEGIPFPSADD